MALIAAFAATLVATPLAARLARRVGALDRPGALKVQQEPVPYLGGLAVAAGLLGANLAFGAHPWWTVPLVLALLLGVVDDLRSLPPPLRLAVEVGVGAVVAAVAPLDGWGPAGAVVAVGATVLLVNAVNLVDGLDGLAGGVCLASAVGLAVTVRPETRPTALALTGALVAFLVFNKPPARIYLGDGGAYLLGTALALLALDGIGQDAPAARVVAVPLLVAVPVLETAVAIARRARAHLPLFEGDRSHVYDQLVDRGWTRTRATLAVVVAQVLLAAVGAGLARVGAGYAAAGVVVALVAATAVVVAAGFLTPAPRRSVT